MSVVVGVDASPGSLDALRWTLVRTGRLGRAQPVMAWHYPLTAVIPAPFGGSAPPPAEEMQAAAEAALRDVLSGLDAADLGDPIVVQGDSADVLVRAAADTDADALVVGTRGRGGFAGLVLGSVSTACAHHATVPVIVVPDGRVGEAGPERIVVGIDGSEGSERALRWALGYAQPGDEVVAVAAWELRVVTGYEGFVIDPGDLETSMAEVLGDVVGRIGDHDVPVEQRVVRGDARSVLADEAAVADLLVVGARGHGVMRRMLLGSVANSLVHHVACPTVIVPHDRELD